MGVFNSATMFLLIAAIALAIQQYSTFIYQQGPPPADFGDGEMFDKIASRYDFINRVLALRMDVSWRKKMVQTVRDRVAAVEAPRLLDVATGTADVAIRLAEIPSATILGVDPSNNMLDQGRRKIKEKHLDDRIVLEWADARDLQRMDSDSFDGATISFGIRNVPEREVALCEIHRVLKSDGVLAILEFSEPDDSFGFLGVLARLFIRHVVPVIGGILSGKPQEYAHLQNSIKDFPEPKEFKAMMENLSCGNAHSDEAKGSFAVDAIEQLNFGSVQLYTARARTTTFN